MYWYDKPSDIGDEPELEFFDKVPVVWDASNVIHGEIGQFVTIARKKGEEWFIGSITNNDGREIVIPKDFLDNHKKYTARIYSDGDENIKTRTKVKIEDKTVDSTSTLKITLKPSGGQAVHLSPL